MKVNYTKELLEEKIKDCYSFAELCRRLGLNPEGSNPKTLRKKLDLFGIDYSHFTGQGWNQGEKYKPIKLFEYLIKTYTNEGDLVLDNCSGSGTTAIACLGTKRNFICIEKDEVYYKKSLERVEEYNKQLKLF